MPFPYSEKTEGLLIDAIDAGFTDTKMGTLFRKAGVRRFEPDKYRNKEDRVQWVLTSLRNDRSTEGDQGALKLARSVLVAGKPHGLGSMPTVWWEPLRRALAADGWEFDDVSDSFVAAVPGADVPDEVTWIGRELRRRGWLVAQGHYEQAIENFSDGNWASANGQLRAFFEALIREAGGTPTAGGNGQVQAAFDTLNGAGHLIPDESEFGKKLWKLLHPCGSHPGLSDEDESRFRLLTLTGYSRFLLRRLP